MHVLCAGMIFLLPKLLPPPPKSASSSANGSVSSGLPVNGHVISYPPTVNGHVSPDPATVQYPVTVDRAAVGDGPAAPAAPVSRAADGTLRKRTSNVADGLTSGGRETPLRAV